MQSSCFINIIGCGVPKLQAEFIFALVHVIYYVYYVPLVRDIP